MSAAKFGNVKTEVDGVLFDSKKEARRYVELKLMVRAGLIRDLECQPKFPICVNNVTVSKYIADFQYIENGQTIVEDVKGVQTPIFRLKAKLVKAIYGIEVRIT